jgi:MFS family permease
MAVGHPARAPLKARQLAAVAVGNALEFYDFTAYAFFAAQIGRTFFPSHDPTASLLASLATFGAGFLMRPIGAVVIGRLGDKAGRKPAMLLSFAIMGLAMIGLAVTPAYSAIGVVAPTLAIIFRLLQGFALGGEVGPNTAFLVESAPAHRRGLIVSLQYASQMVAILVAGLIGYVLASLMSDAALDAWGWRAAFLVGAVIVPFGLILRRQLVETLPEDVDEAAVAEPAPAGLRKLVILGAMMLLGGTIVAYVMNYLTTYATVSLRMPTNVGFLATIFIGGFGMVAGPLGGAASDRFGRKPVMIIPWALLLVLAVPGFMMLIHFRSAWALLTMIAVLCSFSQFGAVAVLTALSECIPMRIRSGALGMTYATTIAIFGGSAQFMVAWLMKVTGDLLAPAYYMTGAVAIALTAMILLPESAPIKLRGR